MYKVTKNTSMYMCIILKFSSNFFYFVNIADDWYTTSNATFFKKKILFLKKFFFLHLNNYLHFRIQGHISLSVCVSVCVYPTVDHETSGYVENQHQAEKHHACIKSYE